MVGTGGNLTIGAIYDPSGVYPGSDCWGVVPIAVADWAAYGVLFEQFRVSRIRITFRLQGASSTDDRGNYPLSGCEIFIRSNFNEGAVQGTQLINDIPGTKRFFLTPDKPLAVYAFTPRYPVPNLRTVTGPVYTGMTINGRGFVDYEAAGVPWYGTWAYFPLTTIGVNIGVDVEFTIDWRYRN